MRTLVTAALVLSFALPLAAPVEAQTRRLPRKSASERQVEDINRDILLQQRQLKTEQQIQIDNNQLRQSIDRQRMITVPPPPPIGPSFRRLGTCPAGSVGC